MGPDTAKDMRVSRGLIDAVRKADPTPPSGRVFSESDQLAVVPFLDDTGWPDPIDFLGQAEVTGSPVLLPSQIPEALSGFVFDTAARLGTDPTSVALIALACCSAVISEDWRLQPKRRDTTWTEQARLWAAIIAGPSFMKTPIITACSKPIDRLDIQARNDYQEAVTTHKSALRQWKDAGSEPATEPRAPKQNRYLVEGFTVESLTEVLRDDPESRYQAPARKVLMRHHEMAEWVASFDKYKAGGGGGSDRGAALRLYDGQRHVIDRVGRGSFAIPHWSAALIGAIQPEPIQHIAQRSSDDGLLQRMIFSVPLAECPGEDREPDHKAIDRYHGLFPRLSALHPGRDCHGDPVHVVLHADAHRHRERIDRLVSVMSAMPDTTVRLQSALGKWRGLFARLALTFHLIEVADTRAEGSQQPHPGVVSETTAAKVAGYMEGVLLPHLLRANAVMFSTPQTGHAKWIAGMIVARGSPRLAKRDIVRNYPGLRAPEKNRELMEVMESLVTIGWVRAEDPENPSRSPSAWTVNPLVLTKFAEQGKRERERRKRAQEEMASLIRARSSAHH